MSKENNKLIPSEKWIFKVKYKGEISKKDKKNILTPK